MLWIDDVLLSDELTQRKFVCNLNACQGACCWEGDYGAPVDEEEKEQIRAWNEVVAGLLDEKGKKLLSKTGGFEYYEEASSWGTSLHADGACVYLIREEGGFAKCAIELAHSKGMIPVNKPLSCHLYPIRVTKNSESDFEAWNYDEWDICSAACSLGENLQIPVYEFLKDAIIRAKGKEFYDQIEAAANFAKDNLGD